MSHTILIVFLRGCYDARNMCKLQGGQVQDVVARVGQRQTLTSWSTVHLLHTYIYSVHAMLWNTSLISRIVIYIRCYVHIPIVYSSNCTLLENGLVCI